jgi:hypothetical protein
MAGCAICGRAVRHKKYCAAHSPLSDPAWRQARSQRAAAATKRYHQQRMEAAAEAMTPVEALRHGYRVGYVRAYHFWKAWAARALAQERRKGLTA